MKIDFCVSISPNSNAYLFVVLFFETFFKVVDTTDLSIHVIDKGVDEKTFNYLVSKKANSNSSFTIHKLDKFIHKFGPEETEIFWYAEDTAKTCEWMIENCGDNQWCIISHYDIDFNKDIIKFMTQQIRADAGQISEHCLGLVAYNRKAYNQTFIKFSSISNFCVANDHFNDLKVIYGADPRHYDNSRRITGFDVGELFLLAMQANGWTFIPISNSTVKEHVDHIGAGSNYNNDSSIESSHRSRIMDKLQSKGIPY